MSTNVKEPKRWNGVEVWTYDAERQDDYHDIRSLDTYSFVYVGMEYDTHSECSYLYSYEENRIPVVIMEYMSKDCLVSHFRCLEQANKKRILVFLPNNVDLLKYLDELEISYQPAAGE